MSDALLTQGRDGSVAIWRDHQSHWEKQATLPAATKSFCQCSTLCRSAPPLLSSPHETDDTVINIWDLESRQVVVTTKSLASESVGMAMCTKLCNDGNVLLVGYESGSMISFDCRNGRPVSRLSCSEHPIMCMDVDDCHLMKGACGSVTKTLYVFKDFENLTLSKEVVVMNEGFSSVAVRSDGRIAASGGWDGRIRIFGWKTLKPLAVLDFHEESVQSIHFATESVCRQGVGVIAAGAKDGIVSLWSVYTD